MKMSESTLFLRLVPRAGRTLRSSPARVASWVSLVALAFVPGTSAAGAAEPSRSAQDIARAAIDAAGGDAIARISSMRRKGTIDLEGEMFGALTGTWTLASVPGAKGFQLADFGQGATATGWDGERGWEEGVMGLRDLAPQEVAINRGQWEPHLLATLDREDKLGALRRAANAEIDGSVVYVLELGAEGVLTADVGTKVYVDAESHLVRRVQMVVEVPPAGSSSIVSDYLDYREVEVPGTGATVLLPGRVKQSVENLFDLDIRYTETELNADLDASMFLVPGS